VGIFPNDASIVRLVGAMMLEQNDEWSLNRRYMQLESLQTFSVTAPTRLPAVACWVPRISAPRGCGLTPCAGTRPAEVADWQVPFTPCTPGAAASLRERLEESLTVQPGITGELYRTLRTTSPIEDLNGSIAHFNDRDIAHGSATAGSRGPGCRTPGRRRT